MYTLHGSRHDNHCPLMSCMCSTVRHIAHTSSSRRETHTTYIGIPNEHPHTCLISSMGSPTIPHTNSSIKSNNMDTHSTRAKRTSPSTSAFQDAWSQVHNRFTFTHFMASTQPARRHLASSEPKSTKHTATSSHEINLAA